MTWNEVFGAQKHHSGSLSYVTFCMGMRDVKASIWSGPLPLWSQGELHNTSWHLLPIPRTTSKMEASKQHVLEKKYLSEGFVARNHSCQSLDFFALSIKCDSFIKKTYFRSYYHHLIMYSHITECYRIAEWKNMKIW